MRRVFADGLVLRHAFTIYYVHTVFVQSRYFGGVFDDRLPSGLVEASHVVVLVYAARASDRIFDVKQGIAEIAFKLKMSILKEMKLIKKQKSL